tara:strand:- start:685 stop:1110 length:426 start_codon:yes stop_codon:yes gene_type:complete
MQFQPEFLSINILLDVSSHTEESAADVIGNNLEAAVRGAGFQMHDTKFQESELGTVKFDLIVRPDRCDIEGCDCGSPRGDRHILAEDVVDLTNSIHNVDEVTFFEVSAFSKMLKADRMKGVKVDERWWGFFPKMHAPNPTA